jgi:hypothetical protein
MAVAIVSCTSAHVQAVARRLLAVDLHGQHRQAGGLLDLDLGGARDLLQHGGDLVAVSLSTFMSSPKTLTATSLRTPEISSLKRSWMGWRTRSCCPESGPLLAGWRPAVVMRLARLGPLVPAA